MKKKPPLSSLTDDELQKRLDKILLSALGKAWMYWPPRAEVKRRCAIPGKPGWWRCEDEECQRETEKLEVDHIIPCVKPEVGRVDWDTYIRARFVKADKLQGLCRESHRKKTQAENAVRREQKRCAKTAKPNDAT